MERLQVQCRVPGFERLREWSRVSPMEQRYCIFGASRGERRERLHERFQCSLLCWR